jgi:hypothetical protein
VVAAIRDLQPFNHSKPHVHALWLLRELSNVDKHRMLHLIVLIPEELRLQTDLPIPNGKLNLPGKRLTAGQILRDYKGRIRNHEALLRLSMRDIAHDYPMRPSPPELVVFDCDGVLVDSKPVATAVLADALTRVGVPTVAEDAHLRYRGMFIADIAADAQARRGSELPAGFWEQFVADRARAFERSLQ